MTGLPSNISMQIPSVPKTKGATTAVQSRVPRSAVVADNPDPLEAVIRPIVEGQLRGFVKEHPSILQGVNWFKPRDDKAVTLVNSIAKRIVRDLVCPENRSRIEGALFALWEAEESAVARSPAADDEAAGICPGTSSVAPVQPRSASERGSAGMGTGRSAALLPPVDWSNPISFNSALQAWRE